ncbi:DUF4244 domain-containing protein [Corynebacterium sp. TAE3-ERU16]|nr:DUF4244 domain-containing protein [Corynebacterium sp. TAE3-ERU16]
MENTISSTTPPTRPDPDGPPCPDSPAPAEVTGGPGSIRPLANDLGMSTIEYAMGSIAAAALAAVLYTVITGSDVVEAIRGIIVDALNSGPAA